MKLYLKLRRTDWEKENALQSIFQRLTGVFGAEDLKDLPYLSHFIAKQEVLSGSGAYGFKWTELQLNYHQVRSKTTTEVQFRCNNCKMATDPFRFLRSKEEAVEFLQRFRQMTVMMLAPDPVDFGMYVPPEEPPETDYRCHFEDGRHQNDNVKEWWKRRQLVEQMKQLAIGERPNVREGNSDAVGSRGKDAAGSKKQRLPPPHPSFAEEARDRKRRWNLGIS